MCKKLSLFTFLYFLFFGNIAAQVSDAGLWTDVCIEKKVTYALAIKLTQEFRFNENISELGTVLSDIGINYRISKKISIGGNYRLTEKRRLDNSYSTRHRYYFDIAYKQKTKIASLSFRTRFQSQYADFNSKTDGRTPTYYSRNKLSVKYNSGRKYEPYLASELYYQLNNPDGNKIDNVRYEFGVDYELNKLNNIELFYLIQQEYNVKNPGRDYIMGLGYTISF